MQKGIYFISDIHLGAPDAATSRQREHLVVNFLNEIQPECSELFLLGDVFDFWYEYKYVVPRGFTRLLGKLAEYADAGIKIWYFKGNHDMWVRDYFTQEFNAKVVSDELVIERQGKVLYMHHGDGLGPGDGKYKALKKLFRNGLAQRLFGMVPPAIGMWLAQKWSARSRIANGEFDAYHGDEDEWLVQHARGIMTERHVDYFVFGHRHLPLEIALGNETVYVNTGEWVKSCSYAVLRNGFLQLKYYKG